MLRRPLLVFLLCLFAAGIGLAGEAAYAMQGDQLCMQDDGDTADCGGDGIAASACAIHCAVGACVVSAVSAPHSTVRTVRPSAREAVLTPDCRCAPDTAPPKAVS